MAAGSGKMSKPDGASTACLAGRINTMHFERPTWRYRDRLSKSTGLGGWTDAQIETALTTGKRPDGRELAPVMPLRAVDTVGIAVFMACATPGGCLLAWPLGWLSDRIDRRVVVIATAMSAACPCIRQSVRFAASSFPDDVENSLTQKPWQSGNDLTRSVTIGRLQEPDNRDRYFVGLRKYPNANGARLGKRWHAPIAEFDRLFSRGGRRVPPELTSLDGKLRFQREKRNLSLDLDQPPAFIIIGTGA
jgi:hypothetical protein